MRRRRVVYAYETPRLRSQRHYGWLSFSGDVFMTLITGGFWLIWIFVREMRSR